MRKRPVGIKDIAQVMGVSVATVSRALRDTYDVSERTRQEVLKVAKQLNYKPNTNAAALSSGSTRNIAVIIPFITNYYFSTVISGIQEIAYANGYNLILLVTNDDEEREKTMIENLSITSLDGLLVSLSSGSIMVKHFQDLIDHDVPVVFFDRVPKEINATKVLQDDYLGAFDATEHLINKGYRKIAHIAGNQHLDFTQDRLKGYLGALEKHTLPINDDWIIFSGFSQQCGENDMNKLLLAKNRPDAVFAVNDRKAVGAIIAMKKLGIAVGKTIGVSGFTNDPIASIIEPSLTTVEEPAAEIGRKSCELLIKHITNKHFLPKEIILPATLITRDSTNRN